MTLNDLNKIYIQFCCRDSEPDRIILNTENAINILESLERSVALSLDINNLTFKKARILHSWEVLDNIVIVSGLKIENCGVWDLNTNSAMHKANADSAHLAGSWR